MQQYFVNKIGDKLYLNDNDLYHLTNVLRYKNKNIICIIDNKAYLCNFTYQNKEYSIEIINEIDRNSELDVEIHLYQALIRNENFDLVLQKATELGAKTITPTIFNRNVVKIDKNKEENKINRFNLIVKNASEQSHRDIVPTVTNLVSVKDIELCENEIGLVCYEKNDNYKSLSSLKEKLINADKIKIVIGPEGGIEPNEYQSLLDKGFYSISLGKRILRSETAAFNILSKLEYIIEEE